MLTPKNMHGRGGPKLRCHGPAIGQTAAAVHADIEGPERKLAMTRLLCLKAVTPICTRQEVAKNKATSPRGCLPISPEPKK